MLKLTKRLYNRLMRNNWLDSFQTSPETTRRILENNTIRLKEGPPSVTWMDCEKCHKSAMVRLYKMPYPRLCLFCGQAVEV